MKALHELEDEVIESGRVLYGWDEGHQLALDRVCGDTPRGVKIPKDGCEQVQQGRLEVKDLH